MKQAHPFDVFVRRTSAAVAVLFAVLLWNCNTEDELFAPADVVGSDLDPVISVVSNPYPTIENGGSTIVTVTATPSLLEDQDNKLKYTFYYTGTDSNTKAEHIDNVAFFHTKKIDGTFYSEEERSGLRIVVEDTESHYFTETNIEIERGTVAVANAEIMVGGYVVRTYFDSLKRFVDYDFPNSEDNVQGQVVAVQDIEFESFQWAHGFNSGNSVVLPALLNIYKQLISSSIQDYRKNAHILLIDFYACYPRDKDITYDFEIELDGTLDPLYTETSPTVERRGGMTNANDMVEGINTIDKGFMIPGTDASADPIHHGAGTNTASTGTYVHDNVRQFQFLSGYYRGVFLLKTTIDVEDDTGKTHTNYTEESNAIRVQSMLESEKELSLQEVTIEEENRFRDTEDD